MRRNWTQLLAGTLAHYRLRNWLVRRRGARDLARWESQGRPSPPPHMAKQRMVHEFATRFGTRTLVETGTYYGDMIAAMRSSFDRIVSIELSQDLHRLAKIQFAGCDNVELIQGDSAEEISGVIATLEGPTLFWLDGHYSAGVTAKGDVDTPISEELEHVLREDESRRHVVLVDDARCFGSDPSYPTLQRVVTRVHESWPAASIDVDCDCIRIVPSQ